MWEYFIDQNEDLKINKLFDNDLPKLLWDYNSHVFGIMPCLLSIVWNLDKSKESIGILFIGISGIFDKMKSRP